MLAGARPASAVELGFLDRLARVWSAVAAEPEGLWDRWTDWFGGVEKTLPLGDDSATTDMHHGSDPNGAEQTPELPPGGAH